MDTTYKKRTLELGELAAETIADMHRRVSDLATWYGPNHEWTAEANRSLSWNLSALFSRFFGNHAVITKDGDLSLFVAEYVSADRNGDGYLANDPHFVYGLIWHRIHRRCERCEVTQGYEHYHKEAHKVMCGESMHEWNYPLGSPEPGTWSFHS